MGIVDTENFLSSHPWEVFVGNGLLLRGCSGGLEIRKAKAKDQNLEALQAEFYNIFRETDVKLLENDIEYFRGEAKDQREAILMCLLIL